jgi:branched-chain amino acid transport system ATP-binding protein
VSALLEVIQVNKKFGTVTAADGLNVRVPPAEVVGIVGANGAGKTVFVNMITGYEKPDSGKIVFDGRDITPLAPRQVTRLGISRSFQVSQVFQSMKVSENLLVALSIHRNCGRSLLRNIRQPALMQGVDELVERFGLSRDRDRPAHELSQGARKLLDIAMACVGSPRVLMLDEPTSGISTEEKFEFMARVTGALARENATVLIVEHDMDIIQRFVSRVLAFAQGRIVCDASPQDALRDPNVVQHVLGIDHAFA